MEETIQVKAVDTLAQEHLVLMLVPIDEQVETDQINLVDLPIQVEEVMARIEQTVEEWLKVEEQVIDKAYW